jgi:dipeptidyl aminopeptidase/acylaminoacyl peptidase
MQFLVFFLIILTSSIFLAAESSFGDEERRNQEEIKILEISLEYAKFYEPPTDDVEVWEITENILESSFVSEVRKQSIRDFGRRIFVFIYPSDGLKIKGLISFVPNPHENQTLIVLRGGNQIFGILNPGCDFMCAEDYTVISTTYRGGVSEGQDEFGGADVNDVKNLIGYIPQLEQKLSITIQKEKMNWLGTSRGGMQLFLALARFPELQTRVTKIVSLSGILDMRQWMTGRPDMKVVFIEEFGLVENVNEEEWINTRDPLLAADKINPNLPILIIQGTIDNRVDLEEGYHMVNRLQENGQNVSYWELEDGEHCLTNISDRMDRIVSWLKEDS